MWREIKKIIHQHHRFLLTTHVNPDGDGIGSACALTELLIQLGKEVQFVCDSPIPQKFSFLDYHHIHKAYDPEDDYSQTEVMIVLDTHKKERIGRLSALINDPTILTVYIDHHTPSQTFTEHTVIDPHACSVGAMIYTLYKECGLDLNLEAATGIYASVLCDTGRFSYSCTTRKSHKIADECIKLGVDPDLMYSRLFQHVSLTQIRMFAQALQHMETYLDNKVVIQEIRREDYEKIGGDVLDIENIDLEYIHEFNKLIEDVQCVVLLREISHDQVRVSMRSRSDLNIEKVMRQLGGGGHSKAAGAFWKGSLQEVKTRILDLLRDLLDHSPRGENTGGRQQDNIYSQSA